MPSPHGVLVDLSTICKQIGALKRALQRNAMLSAHTISALIESEIDTIDAAIQAAGSNTALYADPTLALRFDYNPDPIKPSDSTVITGGP